jgi:hypothetical protein
VRTAEERVVLLTMTLMYFLMSYWPAFAMERFSMLIIVQRQPSVYNLLRDSQPLKWGILKNVALFIRNMSTE